MAHALLAAPLTFNTINKWANGISDTLALGILNELLGERVPVVAAPCVKTALRRHPAYIISWEILGRFGVSLLDPEHTVIRKGGQVTLDWNIVVGARDTSTT